MSRRERPLHLLTFEKLQTLKDPKGREAGGVLLWRVRKGKGGGTGAGRVCVGFIPLPNVAQGKDSWHWSDYDLRRAQDKARARGLVAEGTIHTHPQIYHTNGPSAEDLESGWVGLVEAIWLPPRGKLVWYDRNGEFASERLRPAGGLTEAERMLRA